MAVQQGVKKDTSDGSPQQQRSARRDPATGKASPCTSGASPSPATSGRRSPGPARSPPIPDGGSGRRFPGGPRGPAAPAAPVGKGSATAAAGGARGSESGPACASGITKKASASGSAKALYRYIVLPGNESVLLTEALGRRPWWGPASGGAADQRWNLWAGLNGQRFTDFGRLPAATATGTAAARPSTDLPSSRRLVNRLQEHRVICTKSGLAGLLAGIQQVATGSSSSNGVTSAPEAGAVARFAGVDTGWIPETYVVPAGPKAAAGDAGPGDGGGGGGGGTALGRFQAAFARHAAEGRRLWIAKPTSLNRGNGIEVFDSLERVMEHTRSRPAGSSLILQKYIERPLLLGGRKFDIRAYVLVGPDGSVWFHKEAYCRTSSTPYDGNDLTNRSAHLTNDAVQKHLDSYNAYEDHCKLSLEELGPALREAAAPPASGQTRGSPPTLSAAALGTVASLVSTPGDEGGLWGAMRRCVAALFSAAAPLMNPRRLAHCFELLGLDFMLDEDGRVYLIEVNTSPALFRAGAYLTDLLPRLVEEVVQKAVDPLFPPPSHQPPPSHSAPPPGSGTEVGMDAGTEGVAGVRAPGTSTARRAGEGEGGPPGSRGGTEATPEMGLLDGFVRVELDERFGAAAAAAAGAKASVSPAGTAAARAALLKTAAGVVTKTVPYKSVVAPGQGAKGMANGSLKSSR